MDWFKKLSKGDLTAWRRQAFAADCGHFDNSLATLASGKTQCMSCYAGSKTPVKKGS